MKKFVLAFAAAALTATPVLAAPNHAPWQPAQAAQNHHGQRPAVQNHRAPQRQVQQHNWKRGERFEARRATNYRVITNPRAHRLNAAPRGYRWVQSGRDALLIRISNNMISQVVRNAVR